MAEENTEYVQENNSRGTVVGAGFRNLSLSFFEVRNQTAHCVRLQNTIKKDFLLPSPPLFIQVSECYTMGSSSQKETYLSLPIYLPPNNCDDTNDDKCPPKSFPQQPVYRRRFLPLLLSFITAPS